MTVSNSSDHLIIGTEKVRTYFVPQNNTSYQLKKSGPILGISRTVKIVCFFQFLKTQAHQLGTVAESQIYTHTYISRMVYVGLE